MTEMKLARFLHRFLVRQTMPSVAVNYYERLSKGVADFYLKLFVEDINRKFSKGARILDVGTGIGYLPVKLAQENRAHFVTGLDLSRSCIRLAQAKADQAGVSERVRFVRGEVSELQDQFDLIVSTCSLHHWRYPVQMLRSMAELVNETGQIWLLDDLGDVSDDARKAWITRVEAAFSAGFLFRTVFLFESRYLAYKETEILSLCQAAALQLYVFKPETFFSRQNATRSRARALLKT